MRLDNKKNYIGIDLFRIIAVILVIMNHTYPLAHISETTDFVITRIIARVAVPFFFMVSGYFSVSQIIDGGNDKGLRKSIFKICKLYFIASIIYLPINIYSGKVSMSTPFIKILEDIIFNGTFYHLWYLPAAIVGMMLLTVLLKKFKTNIVFAMSILLYAVGLLGDSYYYLFNHIPVINSIYDFIFSVCEYTRNGLFIAPVFLLMGAMIAKQKKEPEIKYSCIEFILSILLMVAEGLLLMKNDLQRHSSMYIMLLPSMYFLFEIILQSGSKFNSDKVNARSIRNISMAAYIIHPLVVILVRGAAKVIGMQKLFVDNNLIHFILVACASFVMAWIYDFAVRMIKNKNKSVNN